jgi:hypothetical protein
MTRGGGRRQPARCISAVSNLISNGVSATTTTRAGVVSTASWSSSARPAAKAAESPPQSG